MGCGTSTPVRTTPAPALVTKEILPYAPAPAPAARNGSSSSSHSSTGAAAASLYADQTLRALFAAIDVNGDGEISAAEMRAQFLVNSKLQKLLLQAGGTPEFIMKHLDLNGDGVVSWQEFETMLAEDAKHFLEADDEDAEHDAELLKKRPSDALMRGSSTALRKVFDKIDTDHNGKVDPQELRRAMTDDTVAALVMQAGGSRDQCFERLDTNGDSFISWEEFSASLGALADAG